MYITQDPIKLIGGINNFYQYCRNPINWTDPKGFKGMPGTEIESFVVPEGGIYAEMALSPEQATGEWGLGSWATTENITSVDFVRNNLAVTPQFKQIISHVQKIFIAWGVRIQGGTVDPQIYNGIVYPSGGTQIQILLTREKIKKRVIPIGKPRTIN